MKQNNKVKSIKFLYIEKYSRMKRLFIVKLTIESQQQFFNPKYQNNKLSIPKNNFLNKNDNKYTNSKNSHEQSYRNYIKINTLVFIQLAQIIKIVTLEHLRAYQYLYNFSNKYQNHQYSAVIKMATRSNAITLTNAQLAQMKVRANLMGSSNPQQNKQLQLYNQSLERTSKWTDNYRDLKKRKEQEKYKKFEKEQLQRRKIDAEEAAIQRVLKQNQLKKANNKLFQDNERVRALNSQLLLSDTLQGRQKQLQIKNYLNDIEKNREQYYHEELLNQIAKQEEQERLAKEREKQKLKKFEKNLRKQHKEVKKGYIQKMKDEMEQGELLRLKNIADIQAEQEKQRQKRQRAMQLNQDIKVINVQNQELKNKQLQKEREQEEKIQQYRKNQEILEELKKKTQQGMINEKIQQRQQLYKKQAQKLAQVVNRDEERLNKQIEELRMRQEELARKKENEKKILKEQYEQSLKEQLEKKMRQKQKEQNDNQHFKQTWQTKLNQLHEIDRSDEEFRKNVLKKNADELKQQMSEKQKKRQDQYRQQLQLAEKAKAKMQDQAQQFKSYAQKSLKQWSDNGKNITHIIKHLQKTMKE